MALDKKWLVRAGLAMLGFIDAVTGLWAVADPGGWFRNFPGLGRHWVGATPPYNQHLAGDAGAGFLAIGAVLLLAALWADRRVIQAALIGSLAHDIPHFAFHLLHPATVLSGADRAASTGGLAFACLVAVVLLVVVSRAPHEGSERSPVGQGIGSGRMERA